MNVEIDEQWTWPERFTAEAKLHKALIASYHKESARIDDICRDDVYARVCTPPNTYEPEYRALVARLEPQLIDHKLVAYHCTRLTPGEVLRVRARGLRVLTPELVRERREQCRADGHLSDADYAHLEASKTVRMNQSDQRGQRTGMIWFCPNRPTLTRASSVFRLFRYWGGEVVYRGHENGEKIKDVIAAIGTPCIVKCSVAFSLGKCSHQNFSERFLSRMVADDVECPEPAPNFDLSTNHPVTAFDILGIIEYSSADFERLTGHSSWHSRYAIN